MAQPDFLTLHLPVLPVLLPATTGIALVLMGDEGRSTGLACDGAATGSDPCSGTARWKWVRRLALLSTLLGLLLAARLLADAAGATGETAPAEGLRVYLLGNWAAPFGIVLVVDRLAALMLMLTACIALPVLLFACQGWDARGRHFHALFQFQLMGLNGAFLTGDLFNLFVFFEVLLISSYVLMTHGHGRERFRAGFHYVGLNLLASALFLIGASLVYAMAGTLNLADLTLRLPGIGGPDAVLLQAAGLILLVVFAFKAAAMPLSLWLPATYSAACAPVAALFAIMTKVGVYAIVRVHGALWSTTVLLPLALATSVVGVLGALSAGTLPRLVAWLTMASVGTVLTAVAIGGAAAWSAAIFYMVNSTLVIAGLFLWCELVAAQRGPTGDRLAPGSAVTQPAVLGVLMLVGAASAAGLPPLPGFIAKVMLLQASATHAWAGAIWAVVLGTGLLALLALARAGSRVFWQVKPTRLFASAPSARPLLLLAAGWLLGASILMSVFADPIKRYTDAAAAQLGDAPALARAVLAAQGGIDPTAVRPYHGAAPVLTGGGLQGEPPREGGGTR
jgi:multicomponent K+:H+ antiporter subunit D